MASKWNYQSNCKTKLSDFPSYLISNSYIKELKFSSGVPHFIRTMQLLISLATLLAVSLASGDSSEQLPEWTPTAWIYKILSRATLYNYIRDGQQVSLDSLYFYGFWYAPCKNMTPVLAGLKEKYKRQFEIIWISRDHSEEEASRRCPGWDCRTMRQEPLVLSYLRRWERKIPRLSPCWIVSTSLSTPTQGAKSSKTLMVDIFFGGGVHQKHVGFANTKFEITEFFIV